MNMYVDCLKKEINVFEVWYSYWFFKKMICLLICRVYVGCCIICINNVYRISIVDKNLNLL